MQPHVKQRLPVRQAVVISGRDKSHQIGSGDGQSIVLTKEVGNQDKNPEA